MRREKMGEKTKTRKDGGRRSRGRGRGRVRRRRRAISKRESTPKGATPRAGAKTIVAVPVHRTKEKG
tara:strand:- start:371 stop:571 length:201 start_codon:yes stop_codon:yes gene_type:complete